MGRRSRREDGNDYVTYVDWTRRRGHDVGQLDGQAAERQGQHHLPRRPGRQPGDDGQLKSIVKVFAKHPGMKLLTGKTTWPVTNWDPATAQKQMSALLAKYPKIDGIISDYGTDALAATRAFQAAGRKLVPVGTLDANGLSCLYKKTRKSARSSRLATISTRNWLGRIAARKAIAAAEGLPNDEPSRYALRSSRTR